MTATRLIYIHDGRPVACASCAWAGPASHTAPINDIGQRLDPGSTVPAGECPKCGALAYLHSPQISGVRP